MQRRGFAVISLVGFLLPASASAQSIGPDGRPLPTYSGDAASSAAPLPFVVPVPPTSTSKPMPAAPTSAPGASTAIPAPASCPTAIGAYYLQSNAWVSMDPSHSTGFKTTNVAGSAFSYGATKAQVKAQFRDPHSPYQLRSNTFAICLVGITDSGRDITVAKFQEEKNRREISMGSYRIWTGINAQIDPKAIIPDMAAMTKANTPTSLGGYDFGHHEQ